MILKIFKAVWFISMLIVVANLLYVYAGLPEDVIVFVSDEDFIQGNKETLFYAWLALITIINAMVYFFSKSLVPDEHFRTWFTGLIISINTFLIIGLSFIGLYNSNENFDFTRIGYVLYFGIGVVGVWLTSWPVFQLIRKITFKA